METWYEGEQKWCTPFQRMSPLEYNRKLFEVCCALYVGTHVRLDWASTVPQDRGFLQLWWPFQESKNIKMKFCMIGHSGNWTHDLSHSHWTMRSENHTPRPCARSIDEWNSKIYINLVSFSLWPIAGSVAARPRFELEGGPGQGYRGQSKECPVADYRLSHVILVRQVNFYHEIHKETKTKANWNSESLLHIFGCMSRVNFRTRCTDTKVFWMYYISQCLIVHSLSWSWVLQWVYCADEHWINRYLQAAAKEDGGRRNSKTEKAKETTTYLCTRSSTPPPNGM